MKNFKYLVIIASVVSSLISCDNKGDFDSAPPAVNKTDFKFLLHKLAKTHYLLKTTKILNYTILI